MSRGDGQRNGSRRDGRTAADVDALLRTMAEQVKVYRLLRECLERKREGLRTARIDEIHTCCDAERQLIGRIHELERKRAAQAAAISKTIAPTAQGALSATELAQRLDEQRGRALLDLAGQLKSTMKDATAVSKVVAGAAETLGKHLGGIVQTVQGALSRVGVYGKGGRIAVGTQTEHSVDLRS
jgi:predicted anti-sigma-YlaC factor YlaD